MDLKHEFTVDKPIDEAWKILTNVELIAPCLPGAQLEEVEGDTYRGMVKVKVGPIAAAFKGQASFIERDDANYRAVLKGEGRDTGGKGNNSVAVALRDSYIKSHLPLPLRKIEKRKLSLPNSTLAY